MSEITNIAGQPMELFARGKWPGGVDALEAALTHFAKRNQRQPFGRYAFKFTIRDNPAFRETSKRCWMIWAHDFNRETLFTVKVRDGLTAAEGGEPYAEVLAREVPGGLAVELLHTQAHADDMRNYLARLRDALTEDGLQPAAGGATPGQVFGKKQTRKRSANRGTIGGAKKALIAYTESRKLTTLEKASGEVSGPARAATIWRWLREALEDMPQLKAAEVVKRLIELGHEDRVKRVRHVYHV